MTETYGGRTFDLVRRADPRNYDHLFATAPVPSRYDLLLRARIEKLEQAVFPSPAPPAPVPVPPAPVPSGVVLWPVPVHLDQGPEGECVGFGFTHWRLWAGVSVDHTVLQNPVAEALYESAQRIDQSPADEQSGATMTGGAKACQQLGGVTSYRWALSVTQVAAAITAVGPVLLGIPWRSTMMNPDAHGVLDCSGPEVGGHCICAKGYYPKGTFSAVEGHTLVHQSWGNWGPLHGDAYIPDSGLASLMAAHGEAAVLLK